MSEHKKTAGANPTVNKELLICEKPSVAQDIARSLPEKFKRREGWLESSALLITWARGHLLELALPEVYNSALRRWTLASLPIVPGKFKLVPRNESGKQLQIIEQLLQRPDVTGIINGCDAGREGELIFRYIYYYCNCVKPFRRLWLSETTDKAISQAFANLRGSNEMENLFLAALARSRADWLVGINATRAFSVIHHDKLSVGRVQTPTLALIVQREREIEEFVPQPYFELWAGFVNSKGEPYRGKWFKGKKEQLASREEAEKLQNKFTINMKGLVKKIQQKENKENPPLLFNLNDLQKLANQKFGLTAEQTLNSAQKLYESKLLTYPRTDSRHLTKNLAASLPQRLRALQGTELEPFLSNIRGNISSKRYVDDSKVGDHTAIIITEKSPREVSLGQNEKNLYFLVARRVLSIFFPAARYLHTTVITELDSHTFISKGRVLLEAGWKTVAGNESREQELPALHELEPVVLQDLKLEEKQSQPPKRYTEADLLSAMENAGKMLDDKTLKEAMKGKGLGTPATRAAIIEKLIATAYIKREKKQLLPTAKGKELVFMVLPRLKDPELTGEWEKKLLDIEKGQYSYQVFMEEIARLVKEIIVEVKKTPPVKPHVQPPAAELPENALGACPICGHPVLESTKGYQCTRFRQGCSFTIWKTIAGQGISPARAREILSSGRSAVIKGFTSKKGTPFDAALRFDGESIVFDFSKR